jgi:hypothetical protein
VDNGITFAVRIKNIAFCANYSSVREEKEQITVSGCDWVGVYLGGCCICRPNPVRQAA